MQFDTKRPIAGQNTFAGSCEQGLNLQITYTTENFSDKSQVPTKERALLSYLDGGPVSQLGLLQVKSNSFCEHKS